ncbi:DUF2730 family protein [Lonepinella koalarum]|uniref:DUF2730 family protein n=1 Tax=Lonepinella koalarum TaxID=53417 RepID=UPI0011E42505|nr:DUF2730 family protein [Lonepinella koalarum]TYG34177.1 DUF2730 family protein [Lonepinella koalarum]
MSDFLDALQRHWGLIVTVAGAVWAIMKLSMDSKYPNKNDLKAVRQNIFEVEARITHIEDTLEHLPTMEQISELNVLMTAIKGEMGTVNSRLSTLTYQVNLLIEDRVRN